MTNNNSDIYYLFLDESGNFDFSLKGTKYFTITCITKNRPFEVYNKMIDLKYDLIESGNNIEFFHASEDKQIIREKVFNIIKEFLSRIRIYSIVVEKRKTNSHLQKEERFYPEVLGYLLKNILKDYTISSKIIIITDKIPVNKKREIIEKSIKKILKTFLPPNMSYVILHHDSKSNICLQIADYCNWAIYRKWEKNDCRSYDLIYKSIQNELVYFNSKNKYC
jgi:hypothetical protein